MPVFGSSGVPITMKGAASNVITLQPGEVCYPNSYQNPQVPGQGVGKAGWFYVAAGRYTNIQALDPITQIWRGIGDNGQGNKYFSGDGANVRLANQSGCAVAAVVTTAGSGYTSPPTVVASAGASIWRAILGPLVNTSATVVYGGTNYTYPPLVVIDAPPVGGVQATGHATLTGSVVSSITIDNQGAGYSSGVPNVTLVNDPRDTTGSGAQATVALTGAGTVAAVVCIDHGNPITSGTVPTLTFGSGSAAATALMNWAITTYSVTTPGAGYANTSFVGLTAVGPAYVGSPSYTNPNIQDRLIVQRNANIWVTTGASTGPLTTGGVIEDGGVYRGVPTQIILSSQTPSTVGVLALTLGGVTDTSFVQPY